MAQLNAACRDKFSGHDELRPRNPLQVPQHSLDGSLCRHAELARTGHLRSPPTTLQQKNPSPSPKPISTQRTFVARVWMVHGHVEKASRELSAASQGHGVFLCRGCHFALIAMARKSNLAGQQQQRTELPRVLMNNGEHSAGRAMESPGNSRVSVQNACV